MSVTERRMKINENDFYNILRQWSLSFNYGVVEKSEDYLLYNKSMGVGYHCWIKAQHDGTYGYLEGWLGPREKESFLNGNKIRIGSGISIPSHVAKGEFNKLLDLFQEPRL